MSGAQHRCVAHLGASGQPFLAFELSSGGQSDFSNSLFTLDLQPGVSLAAASSLAAHINELLKGVSTTVF